MKIKKPPHTLAKRLLVPVIATAVAAGGYGVYALQSNTWPFESTATNVTHDNDSETTSSNKRKNTLPANTDPIHKTPKHYETPQTNNAPKDTLTGTINYKGVVDDKLMIRLTINEQPSSGSCTLTLTNKSSGKTVKKSANIVNNPSSSTCDGFNIPLSELPSGSWTITVNLSSGSMSGRISGEVVI